MFRRLTAIIDPFVMLLLLMVLAASLLPPRGAWVGIVSVLTNAAIALLFFLHGAKLSREAIIAGALHWRLHLAVLSVSFILFPLLGLAMLLLPSSLLPPEVAPGLLYLTLLPSTVQSSIAFTAIAGGNVPAAVCSASFSNLLGTVLTPLLVALTLSAGGDGAIGAQVSLAAVEKIVLQLVLPFFLGHLARPWIGGFLQRHATLASRFDRGTVLLVVYAAFGAAVSEGLWSQVSVGSIGAILVASALLLAIVMSATRLLSRLLRLPRADGIVLFFCGSKKSLATGAPMAALLFPPAQVGLILLPAMMFHQLQLMVCAVLARRFAAQSEGSPAVT